MQIIPTRKFNEDIEFYIRKKKFNIPENTSVYKVRIANSSTNVGKSHGLRLWYYVAIADEIYLLAIYSKKDDIRIVSDKQIERLVEILLEPQTQEEE